MTWTCGGFKAGETVELREPGERVFTDDQTAILFPVSSTAVADELGRVTLSPSGAVKGVSATGRTSGRRVVKV